MRFRKRYVVAALGTALFLFCAIKYSLEWRREFASPVESLLRAREALEARDVDGAAGFLDEALDRASQDVEGYSSTILEELLMLDGSPSLPLHDAARLYQRRIELQRRNCRAQAWDAVLQKRVRLLGWPEEEASAHYHMLHPGRELLEMCVARAETLGTFAAWQYGRQIGQELKDAGAVPPWAHVLRALANLKAREMDGMGLVEYPVAPIMGWLRDALKSRPQDAMLQRCLHIGLAIAKADDTMIERTLPREDPLVEAVVLSDTFSKAYEDNIPGQVNRIETRVRAAEDAALSSEPSAQELLDQFAAACPAEANWREILRAGRLQVRALRLHDPGSPEYAQGIANVRRMAGSLLERWPGAPDGLLLLGTMYRQVQQEDRARECFLQAAETTVACPPSLRALTWDLSAGLAGLALVEMDIEKWEQGTQPSPAGAGDLVARIDRATVHLGGKTGETLLARGRVALLAGRPREGIAYLEEACRRVGRARPVAFLRLGQALSEVGETGIAATRLDQLLQMPQVGRDARLQAARELAALALRNLPPDQAAVRVAELTAHHPGDPALRLARARALLHSSLQRTLESAARMYQLGDILDMLREQVAAGDEEATLLAAKAEALLGDGPEAVRGLEAFCQQHPEHVRGLLAWCRALRLRGESPAEEDVVRAYVLPRAAPPVAALLERALRPEPEIRRLLDSLVPLAFVHDPTELQLGLFWVHWGLGDDQACAAALDALPEEALAKPDCVAARFAFLLDSAKAPEARALLDSPAVASLPEWQRQLWLAKLLLVVRDSAAAESVLARLTSRNPHLSEALALQGVLAMRREKPGEALLRFRASLAANPMQPLALEGIVDMSLADREPVQALTHLRKLVRVVSPCQPRVQLALLKELTHSGTVGGAVDLRERLRQQAPWDRSNRRELALLYLQQQQLGPAGELLAGLAAEQPSDISTSLLLAQSLVAGGRRADARKILVRMVEDPVVAASDPSCLAAADLLAQLDAGDEALRLLDRVAASGGQMAVAANARLGDLLYQQGDWKQAAAAYAKCEQVAERPDLVRRRAECLIRAGLLPEAKGRLARLAELVPDDPMVHVLGAEAALADGDLERARRDCEKALKCDPGCAAAFLARARLDIRLNDDATGLDAGIRDLEKACARDPSLVDARELLVRLLLERGRSEEASATLGMLVGALPEEPRLKLALARLLLELGRDSSLASAVARWRGASPEEPVLWRIQGMLAARQGYHRGAAVAYEQHFAKTGDPRSLLVAIDSYLAEGLAEDAERLCQTCDGKEGVSPEALVGMALVRLREQPAEARHQLTKALSLVHGEDRLGNLLGYARQLLPPAELLSWLEEMHKGRHSTSLALMLADVADEVGEPAKAIPVLEALAEAASGDRRSQLLARLAEAEYVAGKAPAAEEILRKALAIHPGHPALLNNAAHLALLTTGREAEAVRLARRAVEASTDDRELHACALSTLGEALFRLRLHDQARDVLLKAVGIHDNAEDRLLLGRALLGGGHPERGAAQLRKAREMAELSGNQELLRQIDSLR